MLSEFHIEYNNVQYEIHFTCTYILKITLEFIFIIIRAQEESFRFRICCSLVNLRISFSIRSIHRNIIKLMISQLLLIIIIEFKCLHPFYINSYIRTLHIKPNQTLLII